MTSSRSRFSGCIMSDDGKCKIAATIAAAEDIFDPMEVLVERTSSDPAVAFMPDVLVRLAAMKRGDRAGYEALRAKLKGAGCRVTALDEAIDEANGDTGGGRRPSQADVL